jgi:hypothetical protein
MNRPKHGSLQAGCHQNKDSSSELRQFARVATARLQFFSKNRLLTPGRYEQVSLNAGNAVTRAGVTIAVN